MKLLFDAHCHAMTLARPALGPFVEVLARRGAENLLAQVSAPSYLLLSMLRRGGEASRNLLAVAENDVAGMLMLMEDDLAGRFGSGARSPAFGGSDTGNPASGDAGLAGDLWVVSPLMMDFARPVDVPSTGYYPASPGKPLKEAVREMLAGVAGYRQARPDGRLAVRPFLGLDSGFHGAGAVEGILDLYFRNYRRGERFQLAAFRSAGRWKGDPLRPLPNSFAGVKLYPPLGFDPWPPAAAGRDAARILYGYCERRGIPLTVHCDDQGYRTVPLERSLELTDPARWAPVLEAYPQLIVDFAHFGERYLPAGHGDSRDRWTRTIAGYMERYPGVYADVAFNGADPEYWKRLASFLDSLTPDGRDAARERLLFGSDFFINLAKCRSYLDYVRDFIESPLDEGLRRAMLSDNPARFLFGSE